MGLKMFGAMLGGGLGAGALAGGGSSVPPPPPPPGSSTPVSTGGVLPDAHAQAAAAAAADHAMGAGDLAGKTQAATAAQSSSYQDTSTSMGLGG